MYCLLFHSTNVKHLFPVSIEFGFKKIQFSSSAVVLIQNQQMNADIRPALDGTGIGLASFLLLSICSKGCGTIFAS